MKLNTQYHLLTLEDIEKMVLNRLNIESLDVVHIPNINDDINHNTIIYEYSDKQKEQFIKGRMAIFSDAIFVSAKKITIDNKSINYLFTVYIEEKENV